MSRAHPIPADSGFRKTSSMFCPDVPGMMPADLLVTVLSVY
jgi:hypothetical protein